MPSSDVEKNIQYLVDLEAIKRLRSLYCYYADAHDSEKWASLFTEDGVFETDVFGTHEGRDAIRALQHLPFAIHYVMNPIIDIDGDQASGKWLLWEPCSFPQDDARQPIWGAAKYEDDYLRVGSEWKFKRVKLRSLMWSPVEQGWEQQRVFGQ